MDIEDEIIEAQGENYSNQPSISSPSGGNMVMWSIGKSRASQQKGEFGSSSTYTITSPK